MLVKISEIMAKHVILAKPNYSIRSICELMERHHIHAIPVVDSSSDKIVRGIVSSADLTRFPRDDTPVVQAMSLAVKTVSADADARQAARIMRKHAIHHVVVTDDGSVVGIVSSLDLLKLIEDYQPPG